jgi:endoglucanase
MFKFSTVNSAEKINTLFQEAVGPEKSRDFWDEYLESYITEDDIRFLKGTGVNHIRLPFHYKLLTNDDYLGRNYHGYKYIDRAVAWAKKYDLLVLLDMHAAPCGQTGDNIDDSYGYPYLLVSKRCQETFIDTWRRIADHYKDEPTILGYDLLNEPVAHHFEKDTAALERALVKLYKETTKSIREVDKNHIIFIGGSNWNTNFSLFGKPFDDNLVYEFHKYWMDVKQEEIQQYVDFSKKYAVPIYVGETGENTDEWVRDFRVLLEKNNIGWAFWPYKKMNNSKGFMNFKQPAIYQKLIDYSDSDRRTYENIRNNLPEKSSSESALKEFNVESLYENNTPNNGYIEALGLKVPKK